ncbi:DUF3466 family protein [Nostoc sp. CHAB 5844]|nr:DUF3466 family protein [Nostoc sp. CHAB 5844]
MFKMKDLKTTIKNLTVVSSSAVLMTLGMNASAMAAIFYDLTDIGTLPNGNRSLATDINNVGQVVGVSYSNNGDRAFLWSKNTGIENLGTPSGDRSSFATSINDAGQVVGASSFDTSLNYGTFDFLYNILPLGGLPFYWSRETGISPINGFAFPSPSDPNVFFANSQATSINNLGQVLVKAQVNAARFQSFVWNSTNGATSSLSDIFIFANDINDSGQIAAGTAILDTGGNLVTNLGQLPTEDEFGSINQANAINNQGQVVGFSNDRAFFWSEETGIVALTNSFSEARDINDNGEVVGVFSNSAFVGSQTQGLLDLNSLIDPSLGWTLLEANGINNQGQIVGFGLNSNGQGRAFLLTPRTAEPVPEPITMGGTLLAGVGLAYLRRQRQLRSSKVAG